MYNKPKDPARLYEPLKIRRLPHKKSRYVKYRPQTLQDWEELED